MLLLVLTALQGWPSAPPALRRCWCSSCCVQPSQQHELRQAFLASCGTLSAQASAERTPVPTRPAAAGEALVRSGLLYMPDLDLYLAKAMGGPRFQLAAEFALHLVQQVRMPSAQAGRQGGVGLARCPCLPSRCCWAETAWLLRRQVARPVPACLVPSSRVGAWCMTQQCCTCCLQRILDTPILIEFLVAPTHATPPRAVRDCGAAAERR